MPKKVKIDLSAIRILQKDISRAQKAFTRTRMSRTGKTIVKEMKSLISKGISPIRGPQLKTRFPAYKHAGKPNKYPANQIRMFPKKRQRPVNLFLSGEQMRDLDSKTIPFKGGHSIRIEYKTQMSKDKESGHRDGINGQPKRPTLPVKRNERWAKTIENILVYGIKKALQAYVKKL
jgi:hypothetical protein